MKRTLALFWCLAIAGIFVAVNTRAQTGPGSALVFDGVNDFANFPLFATNAPTNEITIEFWQNVSSAKVQATFGTPPDAVTNRIVGHVPWVDGVVYWDFGNINTAGRLFYTPPTPIVGSWQHFAFLASFNGNYMRIYRNGVLEAQKTGMTPFVRGTNDLNLGQINNGFFAGQLDEFRIWNVARGSNEIATNFMRSLVGNEPGLLLYLRANEGSGTSTADAAALGGNTTAFLSNSVAWAPSGASVGGLFVTMADSLLIDTNGNGKPSAGDTIRYTITIQNNGTNTLTNLVLNVPGTPNNTLVPGSVKVPPKAVDDGPASNSVPGNAFHVALNTPFNLSAPGLLANDTLGAPAGSIASFGGGSFPGTATTTAAGASANNPSVGTLTVNANGSVTFTPIATFNGLATFQYRLTNAQGASIATAAVAVGVRPSALNDTLIVSGNTLFDSSLVPFTLMGNDAGSLIGVSSVATPTFGTFSFNANGNFIFTPDVGETGAANVNYTITNGFGSVQAQIVMTMGNPVWYIDGASVAGPVDGRSHTPFKTIAQFNAVNNGAANNPADNQAILLRDGTYTDGIVLRNGQRLIGDGSSGGVTNALGVALPPGSAVAPGVAIPAFSGIDPIITTAAGNGVALNANNTIRGLTVANTPAGVGFTGGSVGSLTISESSKTGTGGAINITSSGGLGVSFETLDSANAPGAAINLVGCSGTLSATAGTISAPTGAGVFISGGSGNIAYPGPITKNSAGRLVDIQSRGGGVITLSGNLAQNNAAGTGINVGNCTGGTVDFTGTSKLISTFGNTAVHLGTNTGATINFSNGGLDVDTTSAFAFHVLGGGTVNVTGSGNAINSTTGTTFVNTIGSAVIDINAALTGTGQLINISSRPGGSVTLSGNLNNNPGTGMLIMNNTGGTIALSGTTKTFNTGANTAVNLVNNTGTTINFTGGGMVITTTGTGFNATGGGTISVQGSGNIISSGTGTGLNAVNTTIGAGGLTFRSISSNGGVNGIVLDTTGLSGGLTVTGDGGGANNGSGGIIQNSSGPGINLSACGPIRLAYMNVQNSGDDGIRGSTVASFGLNRANITGNGNAVGERGIEMFQLSGTGGITNSTISSSAETNLRVENDTANLTSFHVTGTTISTPSFTTGDDGFLVLNNGSASMTVSVVGCTFTDNKGDHFQAATDADASGSMNITFLNNVLTTTAGNDPNVIGGGITINTSGTTDITFNISSNSIQQAFDDAININLDPGSQAGASMTGIIASNVIGSAASADSGSESSNDITIASKGQGTTTMLVSNNMVFQYANVYGIFLGSTEGSSTLNATVVSNVVKNPGTFALNGIRVEAGAATGDSGTICTRIVGNDVTGSGFLTDDIRLRQRFNTTIRLPGYAGSASDTAAVNAFISANNDPPGATAAPTVSSAHNVGGGGFGFVGGTPCPTP